MVLELNCILQGDSWALAKRLDDESIDCVVTSPPYWGLRNYGVEGQAGLEGHPQDWVDKMVQLCRLLHSKLKKSGTMWVNIGETYYGGNSGADHPEKEGHHKENCLPGMVRTVKNADNKWLQPKQLLGLPWRFAIAMQDDGWILRNAIIWHKPNHMPSSVKDRFAASYEYVFLFVKNKKYWFDLASVREPYQTHPAKFNVRVRDAKRGIKDKAVYWGGATEEEIRNYDEKAMRDSVNLTKQQQYLNRQVSGFNERWKERHTKIPFEQAEASGSPRARYHRDNQKYSSNGIGSLKRDANGGLGFNGQGKNPGDVWRITTKHHPFAHFAVFPEQLAERCIMAGCQKGGIVLDPFMGSGTVAVVAKKLGRKFVGFEINQEYIDIANKRLKGITNWKVVKEIEQGKQMIL